MVFSWDRRDERNEVVGPDQPWIVGRECIQPPTANSEQTVIRATGAAAAAAATSTTKAIALSNCLRSYSIWFWHVVCLNRMDCILWGILYMCDYF